MGKSEMVRIWILEFARMRKNSTIPSFRDKVIPENLEETGFPHGKGKGFFSPR
jgi:hypothetical protein